MSRNDACPSTIKPQMVRPSTTSQTSRALSLPRVAFCLSFWSNALALSLSVSPSLFRSLSHSLSRNLSLSLSRNSPPQLRFLSICPATRPACLARPGRVPERLAMSLKPFSHGAARLRSTTPPRALLLLGHPVVSRKQPKNVKLDPSRQLRLMLRKGKKEKCAQMQSRQGALPVG